MSSESERKARAIARRDRITARIASHTEREPLGPFGYEGMLLTQELSVTAHLISGGTLPTYTRATMPGGVRRLGDDG